MLNALAGWRRGSPATVADLRRCHTRDYLERLESLDAPTLLDFDTVGTDTSWEAVLLVAGIAIEAARTGSFAIVRPPGHHALAARQMGFCLVNNVAIAARALQADGAGRVAIVDFDVHHGNGTEAIFADDDSVLYASLHQWPFYPGTDEWLRAFEERIAPAVARFDPEVVLVSAGFDAHEEDPLADMRVTANGFRELARRCRALGDTVAAVLEGGYNRETLPQLVSAALDGFDS